MNIKINYLYPLYKIIVLMKSLNKSFGIAHTNLTYKFYIALSAFWFYSK